MKNNKKGFTLVELVIVVAVMAILVAVAIPTIGTITGSARTSVNNTNAKTIESMLKLAEADGERTGVTATAASIAQVLVDAKMGIEEGSFEYDANTGKVTYKKDAAANGTNKIYAITFTKATTEGAKSTVTVATGSGEANTATLNLDGSAITPAPTPTPGQ